MTPFTVVVPTRERADTLVATLRTLTMQDHDRLTILVSDNQSGDDTRDVVSAARDPRIRYLRTDRRLGMSQNWEFALAHVEGGYVAYVGDDDGLLPGAIPALAELIEDSGVEAVGWRMVNYRWPSCVDPALRNTMLLPFGREVERRDARAWLGRVARFERSWDQLPSLYTGVISQAALMRARGNAPGFFHSRTPDLYSAVAAAAVIPEFLYSHRPWGVRGVSGHSTGMSTSHNAKQGGALATYLAEENLPFHPAVPFAPIVPVLAAEALLQARDHVSQEISVDLLRLVEKVMSDAAREAPWRYQAAIEAVREIGARNGIAVDAAIAAHPQREPVPPRRPGVDLRGQSVLLDASRFAVRDVHEASLLAGHLLALREQWLPGDPLTPLRALWRRYRDSSR